MQRIAAPRTAIMQSTQVATTYDGRPVYRVHPAGQTVPLTDPGCLPGCTLCSRSGS